MSDDETTNAPVPSDRREAVREKAQQVRTQQSRARVIRRSALVSGLIAAVAVVAVVVTWAVASTANRPQLSPSNTSNDGFAVTSVTGAVDTQAPLGDDGGAAGEIAPTPEPTATTVPVVEISVYVDYLSPGSREWQLANAKQLASWMKDGAVNVTYHPVSVLTAKSNGTKYSLRAAAAAACVANDSPEAFSNFNSELLVRQPAVDSDGFSDVQLADLAQASSVEDPKQVRVCIENGEYLSWAKAATERAMAGLPGTKDLALTATPMVIVNGQQYVGELGDPAEFSQFVLTSASGAFYKSQTPSPTPTPTATPAP